MANWSGSLEKNNTSHLLAWSTTVLICAQAKWVYGQAYTSNQARLDSLPAWLHDYSWHRLHTEIGGPPATRLPIDNVCVKDT